MATSPSPPPLTLTITGDPDVDAAIVASQTPASGVPRLEKFGQVSDEELPGVLAALAASTLSPLSPLSRASRLVDRLMEEGETKCDDCSAGSPCFGCRNSWFGGAPAPAPPVGAPVPLPVLSHPAGIPGFPGFDPSAHVAQQAAIISEQAATIAAQAAAIADLQEEVRLLRLQQAASDAALAAALAAQ